MLALNGGAQIDIAGRLQELDGTGAVVQTNFGTLAGSFVGAAIMIGALLAFFYMLWGGLDWITSGGDKSKVEQARHKITHAIVGLGLVASMIAIFSVVQYFFGINILGGGPGKEGLRQLDPGNSQFVRQQQSESARRL